MQISIGTNDVACSLDGKSSHGSALCRSALRLGADCCCVLDPYESWDLDVETKLLLEVEVKPLSMRANPPLCRSNYSPKRGTHTVFSSGNGLYWRRTKLKWLVDQLEPREAEEAS